MEFPVQHSRLSLAFLGGLIVTATSPGAHAFNPNAGASDAQLPVMYQQRLPASVVPRRYYRNAPSTTPYAAPVTHAAAVPAYTPPPSTPYASSGNGLAPLPAYSAPAPAYTAPAYPAPTTYSAPMAQAPGTYVARTPQAYTPPPRTATPDDSFTLGIEGYYDNYQEELVSLDSTGYFGGITASYEHSFNPDWYAAAELRAAYGSNDYESISGTIDGIPEWEVETRLLAGYTPRYYQQRPLRLYTGLGTRYFSDELKGEVTNLGFAGYDRRIFQVYLPIGFTYQFAAYGLNFAPTIEYDKLLWGNVSSRLGTLGGPYRNIENEQTEGYGLRGELMMSQMDASGRGWQFGPFFRYWDIPDSDVDGGFIEPKNTRLQAGANVKYLF
jgi:hypothetical protein